MARPIPEAGTWFEEHEEVLTWGEHIADTVAKWMGSWTFIIAQTIFVALWITLNALHGWALYWDGYPFILLNLLFSTQAAYAAPIIMQSQNRHAARDRFQAEQDYKTNREAKKEIEQLQILLSRIETEKLDSIIRTLDGKHDKKIRPKKTKPANPRV